MFKFEEQSNHQKRNLLFAVTLLIGLLSFGSIIYSLMSKEYDLSWISEDSQLLIADIPEVKPDPTPEHSTVQNRPRQNTRSLQTTNTLPIENSIRIPISVSTTQPSPSTHGIFTTKLQNTTGNVGTGFATSRNSGIENGTGIMESPVAGETPDIAPPPIPRPTPKPTIHPQISGGVTDGDVISKPKPIYPPAAIAIRQQGAVVVSVRVDETGKVVAASAVSGPPLLRPAAVQAAWKARFNPKKLSGIPIAVPGTITYNFSL